MNKNRLKPVLFFELFSILVMGGALFLAVPAAAATPPHDTLQQFSYLLEDSVKYQGYRLDLTNFVVLKKGDNWVKIKFTVVNSGRKDVDFGKKGTEHWVQVNFDKSLFDNKLGGLRDNIRQTLYNENFRLAAGEVIKAKTLKVSTLPLPKSAQPPDPEPGFTDATAKRVNGDAPDVFAPKGGDAAALPETDPDPQPIEKENCPDLLFHDLRILQQDDKWATIEYTIENQGNGVFHLLTGQGSKQEGLAIRAYISGVPVLSRGALPIGGQFVRPDAKGSGMLGPGDRYTGKIRLDVRKKTRYMKSLILSLESDQFHIECDKTNNTGAVVLD